MRLLRFLLWTAGLSLGGLGVILCVGSIAALWYANIRLGRMTDNLFDRIDHSLIVARQRVLLAETRVAAATVSSADIEQSLMEWTRQEAGQRVALQVKAIENAERIASALQEADHWLEMSQSIAELVQELLLLRGFTAAPGDAMSIAPLLEELVALRAQLGEATEIIGRLKLRITAESEEPLLEERVKQAVPLTLRLIAMLRSATSRLAALADKLEQARGSMHKLTARAHRVVLAATIGITGFVLWMAAGQAALFRISWVSNRRQSYPPKPS